MSAPSPASFSLISTSVGQTIALGKLLGELAPPNTCIALHGHLGAGKTHFSRGIALGAKIDDPSLICSPTYVLLNIYPGAKPVYHLDAYRIESEEDFTTVGLDELLTQNGITLIEWAEKIPTMLPADVLHITLDSGEHPEQRTLTLNPTGPGSIELAKAFLAGASLA